MCRGVRLQTGLVHRKRGGGGASGAAGARDSDPAAGIPVPVPVAAWSALFAAGVAVSLATSWVLVTRLERLGERAGISEALLGVLAALAADAPEITAAVVALAHRQASVGAGVVIGSNVFNLAALLGLACTGRKVCYCC